MTDTFLDVNQSKFNLWLIHTQKDISDRKIKSDFTKIWLIHIQKGISDRKIKSNLTFCKISSPFGAD